MHRNKKRGMGATQRCPIGDRSEKQESAKRGISAIKP